MVTTSQWSVATGLHAQQCQLWYRENKGDHIQQCKMTAKWGHHTRWRHWQCTWSCDSRWGSASAGEAGCN